MRKLVLALSLISASVHAAATVDPIAQMEMDQYLSQLQGEIQKQTDKVNNLKALVERTDTVVNAAKVFEFENAYTMLNVKKTLYANFVNTPSLQSPLVRAKLLQLFQKDLITAGDLAELEALVKQERPKYVK